MCELPHLSPSQGLYHLGCMAPLRWGLKHIRKPNRKEKERKKKPNPSYFPGRFRLSDALSVKEMKVKPERPFLKL